MKPNKIVSNRRFTIENILKAKKGINLIKIYFIIITVLGDIFAFRNGVILGVLRVVVSFIPIIAVLTMLDSISSGNKKDIQRISVFLGFGVFFGAYSIITVYKNIGFLLLVIFQTVSYIAILLYLFLSKDIRELNKYMEISALQKWMYN